MTQATERPGYRSDLDGLRALAVVLVILYHFNIPYVSGGYIGVDVFFVLSGFFVTKIIIRELASNRFSLLNFYDRRIRRLLPAFFAMLLVSTIAGIMILPPAELKHFAYTLSAAALSLSNIIFWKQSDYFAPAASTFPLLHTWSLALEEQFYVVFPILLWGLWSLGRNTAAIAVCILTVASFALSAWGTEIYLKASFYLLPARFWELSIGAILAMTLLRLPTQDWQRNAATVAGLVSIFVAALGFRDGTNTPGVAAILPCLGAAAIIWAGQRSGDSQDTMATARLHAGARILSLPPFVFVGLISYSLYLWHWPAIVFAGYLTFGALTPAMKTALLVGVFVVSYLSWRFVEQPMRSGERVWHKRSLRFSIGGAAVVGTAALGVLIWKNDGLPGRLSEGAQRLAQQSLDVSPQRQRCLWGLPIKTSHTPDECVSGPVDGERVTVFADSHGVEMAYALSEQAAKYGWRVRQITTASCPPALGAAPRAQPDCAPHVAETLSTLQKQIKGTVVVTAHYFRWDKADSWQEKFWEGFEETVRRLRLVQHRVIVLGPLPDHPFGDVPTALARWVDQGHRPETYRFGIDTVRLRRTNNKLRKIASRHGAVYVPLLSMVCRGKETCQAYSADHAIYFDDNHLTLTHARRIAAARLVPLIRSD